MSRITPSPSHRFKIEIDGLVVAHFQGITGLSSEHEVITHVEGGRNHAAIKLPGQRQYGELTLKRGYTFGSTLGDWIDLAAGLGSGRSIRRALSVIVLGDDARTEMGRYEIEGAWPRKWEIAELVGESALAVESLELAHSGLRYQVGSGGSSESAGVAGRAAAAARAARAARQISPAVRAGADAAASARAGAGGGIGGAAAGVAGIVGVAAGVAAAAEAAASGGVGAAGPSALAAGWAAQTSARGPGADDPAAAVEQAMSAALAAGIADPGVAAPAAGAATAAAAARGFARGDSAAVDGAAGGPPWSDGVSARQPAAGFGESGLPRGSEPNR